MRTTLAALLVIAAVPARAAADRPAFPAYDVDAYCRVQANYSFAATLGDSSFDGVLARCEDAERGARAAAQAQWSKTPSRTLAVCVELAEGRYTHLTRCLDGSATMRTAR